MLRQSENDSLNFELSANCLLGESCRQNHALKRLASFRPKTTQPDHAARACSRKFTTFSAARISQTSGPETSQATFTPAGQQFTTTPKTGERFVGESPDLPWIRQQRTKSLKESTSEINGARRPATSGGASGAASVAMNPTITINGVPTGQEGAVAREVERALRDPIRTMLAQLKQARSAEARLGYRLIMPHGGARRGAGRPRGSGNGPTVEIRSISMVHEVWVRLDQMRGSVSRGVWISTRVNRDFNAREASS